MRLVAGFLLALSSGATLCAAPPEKATPPPATPTASTPARTRTPAPVESAATREKRARYPREWEVAVPEGSKLDALRKSLDKEISLLPDTDLEDRSPLPAWFRVYLRKYHPELKTSGAYQYPRNANRLLQYLVEHPNEVPADSQ
jgi:hypothetical protein